MNYYEINADEIYKKKRTLRLGFVGENEALKLYFTSAKDVVDIIGEGGLFTLACENSQFPDGFPLTCEYENGKLITIIDSSTILSLAGTGKLQYTYTLEEQRKKSYKYYYSVDSSILSSPTPPDPYESWVDRIDYEVFQIGKKVDGFDNRLTPVEGSVTTINGEISTINGEISDINNDIDGINTSIDTIETDIDTLETDIDTLDNKVDTNISTINSEISEINDDIGEINTSIASIKSDITSLDTRVGTTESDITSLGTQLQSVSEKANTNEGNITSLQSDITSLGTRLGTAESNITSLNTRVGENESDINALETKVDTLENEVDTIGTEVSSKANIDGFYESMTVGLAENLLDTKAIGTLQEIGDKRTSCGDVSITDDGVGQIESIRGNSVVFNQLINKEIFKNTFTSQNVTFTNNNDGSITLNGIASGGYTVISNYFPLVNGHKYFLKGFKVIGDSTSRMNITGNIDNNQSDTGNGAVFNASTTSGQERLQVKLLSGAEYNITIIPQLTDLTKIFGSGNEPSTVDDPKIKWLEKVLKEHPEFNEGQIINFYGMKSAGNVYDELTPTLASERVNFINLGSLNWRANGTVGDVYEYATAIENKAYGVSNIICDKLPTSTSTALNTIRGRTNSNTISVGSAESTVENFKQAMQGVMLYYALATPIETPINPPLNLNYKVADFGTEDIVNGKMVTDGFNQFDMDNYFKNVPNWSKINDKWVGIPSDLMNYSNRSKPIWTNNVKYQGQIFITYIGKNTTQLNANFRFKFVYTDGTSGVTQFVQTQSDKVLIGISEVGKIVDKITVDYGSNYEISISNVNINFSWSGYRNGEYEPYWKRETDLHIDDYFTPTSSLNSAFIGSIKYNDDFTRTIANLKKNFISKESMQNFLATLGTQLGGTFSMTWNNNDQDYDFNFTGGST